MVDNTGEYYIRPFDIDGAPTEERLEDIKAKLQMINPDAASEVGRAYLEAADVLAREARNLETHAAALALKWQGSTATKALEQIGKLNTTAVEMANKSRATGGPLVWLGREILPFYKSQGEVMSHGFHGSVGPVEVGRDDGPAQDMMLRLNNRLAEAHNAFPERVVKDLPVRGTGTGDLGDSDGTGPGPVHPGPVGPGPNVPLPDPAPPTPRPPTPPIPPIDPTPPIDPLPLPPDSDDDFWPPPRDPEEIPPPDISIPTPLPDGTTDLTGLDGGNWSGGGGLGSGSSLGGTAGFSGSSPDGGGAGVVTGGPGGRLGAGQPSGFGGGSGPGAGTGRPGMGAPMGGAGGTDEQERERSTWLTEDEDVWGADDDVPPPVIG